MAFAKVDMAQAGGGEMGPSTTKFDPDIQTDMDGKGCTLVACHGTGTPVLILKAMATGADIDSATTRTS